MNPLRHYPLLASLLRHFRRSQQKTRAAVVAALCQAAQAGSFAVAGQLAGLTRDVTVHLPEGACLLKQLPLSGGELRDLGFVAARAGGAARVRLIKSDKRSGIFDGGRGARNAPRPYSRAR